MFGKVLIPLDGRQASEQVLGPALELFPAPSEVVLVHVVDPSLGPCEHTERLEEVRRGLCAKRIPVEALSPSGEPVEQILAQVERSQPDLVAMATEFSEGSVADRMLRTCPVPLLMVNAEHGAAFPSGETRQVLVPLEGHGLPSLLVPQLIALASTWASKVTLLSVVPRSGATGRWLGLKAGKTSESVCEEAQRELLEAGLETDVRTVRGRVVEEILAAVNGSDLVVMATRGRSGAGRWLFGSVTEAVVPFCKRPMLILRVDTPTSEEGQLPPE